MPYILLISGFILLIKGADILVEGSGSIAKRLNVSDIAIGLTVVAFGTSTPELFVNIIASKNGNTDIAIGNIVGSNIANVFLILGVSSIICPLFVKKGTGIVFKGIPFSLLSVLVLGILANDKLLDSGYYSDISRSDGLIFLCFFTIFMYYAFSIAKRVDNFIDVPKTTQKSIIKSILFIIAGMASLTWGGSLIVKYSLIISKQFGISEAVTGLTIIAIGTSLPELATSAVAAYKKNVELAVGNVVGSNIFNIFMVLGISSTINPLPFNTSNNFDIIVMIIANILLFSFMFTGEKRSLDRWEGIICVILYILYIGYLIN